MSFEPTEVRGKWFKVNNHSHWATDDPYLPIKLRKKKFYKKKTWSLESLELHMKHISIIFHCQITWYKINRSTEQSTTSTIKFFNLPPTVDTSPWIPSQLPTMIPLLGGVRTNSYLHSISSEVPSYSNWDQFYFYQSFKFSPWFKQYWLSFCYKISWPFNSHSVSSHNKLKENLSNLILKSI